MTKRSALSQRCYILAHDLGTTGNKATLFDAAAATVATAFEAYETAYPHSNWAEQDPADWWRAVRDSTRELLTVGGLSKAEPGDIAVVSFSGMMNGALAVDATGAPLRSAIIWACPERSRRADQRATAHCCGAQPVYRRTGHRAGASYTVGGLSKAELWIQRHQPELYARTHQFLQAKDYAAYKPSEPFQGRLATDYSDASGTNLFDLERRVRRHWALDMIEAVGLDPLGAARSRQCILPTQSSAK